MYVLDIIIFSLLFCDAFGRLTKKPQNTLVVGNQNAQLDCSTDVASGAGGNTIEWTYDHDYIVWPPCTSQQPESIIASSPNPATDCNIQALSSAPDGISGTYVCIDKDEKAIAMVIVIDSSSRCLVETLDPGSRGATLGCYISYAWHARSMKFNAHPPITASLSWDGSPNSAEQRSHPMGEGYEGRMESTLRVNNSSLNDITRHTCTISFTFKPGNSPMHEYATNTLSWTCAVNDVNAASKGGHMVKPTTSPTLAPADKQNVAGPSRQAETLRAAAVEQEIHRSDRTVNLKLTKNQTLQRRGWLIPLTVVAIIIVVVYFIYNQLQGPRRYPRRNIRQGNFGFGALAATLLLVLFIGLMAPMYVISSEVPHHSH